MILKLTKNTKRNVYLNAIQNINKLELFYDIEGFDSVQFRYAYSFDDVTYTEWIDTVVDLISILNEDDSPYVNIYVRIQVETISNNLNQNLSSFVLNDIRIDDVSIKTSGIEYVKDTDQILQNIQSKNLYQAYRGLDATHELQKKLDYSINKMYGHKCTYFRAEPNEDTRSITFKSYELSSIVDTKELQVMIPDNSVPDNRTDYSEWSYDFFDQLEIHIVIQEFEEAFGSKVPTADDIIFLPLTDRMYSINTINRVKGFMHKASYYQAVLVKYEDRADVNDDFTPAYLEETIGVDINKVEEQDTVKQVEEQTTATGSYNDATDEHDIVEEAVTTNGLEVLRYMFDMTNQENSIEADNYSFANNTEFTVSMWFKTPVNTGQVLFNIIDVNNATPISLSIGSNVSIQHSKSTLRTSGTLAINTKYGLLMNYVFNEKGRYLTITIVDENLQTVQENFTTDIDQISMTSRLQIMSNFIIGNIRIGKNFTKKSDISKVLTDLMPDMKNYYAIQNATPTIKSGQVKLN